MSKSITFLFQSEPKYLGVQNVDAHSLENEEPVYPKALTPLLGNEEQERTIKAFIQSGKLCSTGMFKCNYPQ